jgi:hypothetical protein
LHFLYLFFCVMFLLFHVLILVSDLSLFVRESLLPCWFNKTEKFVLLLFLLCKSECISLA